MLTPPSQRAGRRGLSPSITPSSLKAPRAVSTALQTQLLPRSPGATLFSLSIPRASCPFSPPPAPCNHSSVRAGCCLVLY